ncbi:hypothetical protein BV898_00238 [Hypsibius exemplaris]|uniref:Bulb-type lectin domain-containing protein n=1 Tax=Hypsibius exemplaris TaxID=2072580 RepID=A0A1W0XF61_HYPEX|nr:hypothetical protein BV898_00238 [Hypsibius exemplaris]
MAKPSRSHAFAGIILPAVTILASVATDRGNVTDDAPTPNGNGTITISLIYTLRKAAKVFQAFKDSKLSVRKYAHVSGIPKSVLHRRNRDGIPQPRKFLEPGDTLLVGESLWSPTRNVQAKMQSGRNFVVIRQCDGHHIWTSGTDYPTEPPQSLVMENNGNLAMYSPHRHLLWSTDTGSPRFDGARLRLRDTRSICLESRGVCLWKSGGFALCSPDPSPSFEYAQVILKPGEKLTKARRIVYSKQRSCNLTLQADGDLVVYRACDGVAIFFVRHGASSTKNLGNGANDYISTFGLNNNGDLLWTYKDLHVGVFKDVHSHLQLRGRTDSTNADLRLRDDCRLCVYKSGACLWVASAVTYDCPVVVTTKVDEGVVIGAVFGAVAVLLLIVLGSVRFYYCISQRDHVLQFSWARFKHGSMEDDDFVGKYAEGSRRR